MVVLVPLEAEVVELQVVAMTQLYLLLCAIKGQRQALFEKNFCHGLLHFQKCEADLLEMQEDDLLVYLAVAGEVISPIAAYLIVRTAFLLHFQLYLVPSLYPLPPMEISNSSVAYHSRRRHQRGDLMPI